MKFVGHLMAADVRQHRLLIGLWLLVLAAAAVVEGLHPIMAGEPSARSALVLLSWILWFLTLIVRVVLVVRVVQTHPLVGSDAFWLTRPIPPRTLLLAKTILLAGCLVAAPVVVEAALMALYDVPSTMLIGVAADTALMATALLAVLMAGASVTASFSRFMLLCAGTLAALALYLAVQIAIDAARPSLQIGSLQPPGPEDATGVIGLFVLAAAVFAGLLFVQYETRSRLRSALVGAASLMAALFVLNSWPWPVLQARTELPAWAAPGSAFRLTVNPGSVSGAPLPGADGWRKYAAPVGAIGQDGTWSAGAGLLEATVQLENGTALQSAPDAYPRQLATSENEIDRDEAIRRLLGVRRLSSAGTSAVFPQAVPVFLMREPDFERQSSAQGSYRGRFFVQLTRHQIEATLPLAVGASGGNPPFRIAIDRVVFAFGGLDLRLRESDASSSFDRRPRRVRRYFLRNRRTSLAVEGLLGDFDRVLPGFLGNVAVSPYPYRFHAANIGLRSGSYRMYGQYRGNQGEVPQIDASWLKEAELVVVVSTRERDVERTLDIAPFRFTR